MRIIGFTGYATAGKDTAALALTATLKYERVSFADPLRQMALAIDPVIYGRLRYWSSIVGPVAVDKIRWWQPWSWFCQWENVRLSDMRLEVGWDEAKKHPEVRRLLQRMGTEAVREVIGKDTWVNLAKETIVTSTAPGVVITDVRFANEAAMIRELGGKIYRIDKPGVGPVNGHVSDDAIQRLQVDGVIENSGDVPQLHAKVLALVA